MRAELVMTEILHDRMEYFVADLKRNVYASGLSADGGTHSALAVEMRTSVWCGLGVRVPGQDRRDCDPFSYNLLGDEKHRS